MLGETEIIRLPETRGSCLPLGFRKITLEKIPAADIKKKLLLCNDKYRSRSMEASGPAKPISKMLP
jgi:hypothetical protein